MSVNAGISKTMSLGSVTFNLSATITNEAVIVHDVLVPKADLGSLSLRTNNTEGTITMDESAHGINTGNRVDLYWATGERRGVTVGTVSGAQVPISGGNGDNLPSLSTDINVAVCTQLDMVILGTNVNCILLYTQALGQFVFEDAVGEELYVKRGAGCVYDWYENNGDDNPITGDSIIAVYVSHNDTTGSKIMKVGVGYDND